MKSDTFKRCRVCGQPIGIITWGIYRKAIVNAAAVMVVPDPEGEEFIRTDGSKVLAREAENGAIQAEPAYRLHRKTCGVQE